MVQWFVEDAIVICTGVAKVFEPAHNNRWRIGTFEFGQFCTSWFATFVKYLRIAFRIK